jgi:type VI secretion system secreted protein VgrG
MRVRFTSLFVIVAASALAAAVSPATAQTTLGTAQQFGVRGASTVTNTGATTIKGDLGVSPGTAITGTESITLIGTVHQTDAVAEQARTDATAAYDSFAGMTSGTDLSGQDLGGMTLTPGIYSFGSSAQLTGNLFLDFLGNRDALFVFQIASALTTASGSSVSVLNGAPGGGIYWQVGSSATLGTTTAFLGNVIARESITLTTGATLVCGRAIALTGAVTMDGNTISNDCSDGGDFGTGVTDEASMGFSGAITATPEPAALALLLVPCCGLALLGLARNRRAMLQAATAAV